MHAGLEEAPFWPSLKSAKTAGLQASPPVQELDVSLQPSETPGTPRRSASGSLHCHTVFSAGTQEPVASHRHRQWHSLGNKLGGDILRSEVQTESQESKVEVTSTLAFPRPPTPPMATFLLKIAGVSGRNGSVPWAPFL